MTLSNSDARTRLLTHIAHGKSYLLLLDRYGLPPDTTPDELDHTIRMVGFLAVAFDTVPDLIDASIALGHQSKLVRKRSNV